MRRIPTLAGLVLLLAFSAAHPQLAGQDAVVTLRVEGRSNATPWIASLGETVVVAWGATADGNTDVFVAISDDGGRTFDAPKRVNTEPGEARLGGELPPRVALRARGVRPPEIAVLWTARDETTQIKLARSLDAEARELREWHEDEVEAAVEAAHEDIARARFAVLGTSVCPDATFTLGLNFGSVQGWGENGTPVEPFTRLERMFERATGQPPFAVPENWQTARATLDLTTPFNLSTNSDIVGGNSGSPLIDAAGRIVGLLFDGNIHSISGAYWFDVEKNRAVAVHPAIIREALAKVYRAESLLAELGAAD